MRGFLMEKVSILLSAGKKTESLRGLMHMSEGQRLQVILAIVD